jgi:hypothetical protein
MNYSQPPATNDSGNIGSLDPMKHWLAECKEAASTNGNPVKLLCPSKKHCLVHQSPHHNQPKDNCLQHAGKL